MNDIEQVIQIQKIQHFGTIKKILNKCSYMFTRFTEATLDQDLHEGFDAVFSFPDVKIPIRIRNFDSQKYLDFTIRSKAKYGGKTEIDKLKEGFGDYYFYCWLDKTDSFIEKYMIIDLNKFRKTAMNYPSQEKINADGTCFIFYKLESLIKTESLVIYELIRR